MDPVFDRFSVLRNEHGKLLFARLVNGPHLEVLAANRAYSATLTADGIHSIEICGRKQKPGLRLIALLLSIPSSTWELIPVQGNEISCTRPEPTHSKLLLRCRDKAGLELLAIVRMKRIEALRIMEEVQQSMFFAVAALEATVREAGGEKNSNFLDQRALKSPTIGTVKDLLLPLTSSGQPIQEQPAFRKAAAADVLLQGNRAFVVASTAASVRKRILGQRQARREEEERSKKRQREILRQAKERSQLAKLMKEQSLPAPKRPKRSLFAVRKAPSDEVRAASMAECREVKSEPKIVQEQAAVGIQNSHQTPDVAKGEQGTPGSKLSSRVDTAESPTSRSNHADAPTRLNQPLAKKKKKRRVRALV